MKIYLFEKNPPGVITFHYGAGPKDLTVFISRQVKEPTEDNNQGKYTNVRINFKLSLFVLALKNCIQWCQEWKLRIFQGEISLLDSLIAKGSIGQVALNF